MIVADSDVLIDALRGRHPAMESVAREIRAGTLCTTAVSVFELLSGARSSAERDIVRGLLGALKILPFDNGAAEEAAEIRRFLESEGTPLPMADSLVAGICRSTGSVLVTRNRKHFERVPELNLGCLERASSGYDS